MENILLLLTDQDDQLDVVLSSALKPSFTLEKHYTSNDLDPQLLLNTRSRHPDCILVNASMLQRFCTTFFKSLSIINRSIPVVIFLPFEDPELLRILLDNKLFHYIIFPLPVNNFSLRIKEIISIHSQEISSRDSFFSHPFFKEFRHEIMNQLTITAGYIDFLNSALQDGKHLIYCEKISESIKKIQSLFSLNN